MPTIPDAVTLAPDWRIPFPSPGSLGVGGILGPNNPVVQGTAKTIQSPGQVASAISGVDDAAKATATWVGNWHNWLRVGYVIGGGALILLGVYIAFGDTVAGQLPISKLTKAATS